MTEDRISIVQRLFDEASHLPPAERDAYLDGACGHDSAIREEVASLLRCAEGAGDFLDGQAIDQVLPSSCAVGDPAAMIGRSVGAYRIEKLIGAGGMGIVYLAKQSDPERSVALKLIRPELATPRLVRRLHDEAQVLGRLRHPGIAQIYEAGCANADSGPQPFFAMEYVAGESLVRYADARGLSIHDRLELLARICDALHHAHQHGVIHRDLKPQNILVVDADAGEPSGQPKIIDFGVARVIDTADGTPADRTTADRLVGTLSYMSPEQFEDPREGLDIRSDIYAMGVIGYELLTGRLPHDLRERSIAEAARTISETTPAPLGTQDRALRGDVEVIIMTALAKEKERRYQSASGLGTDLRRAIRNEPITARPPSFWYELRRHAKRNRLAYAAMILSVLLLLAGTIGTSVGVLRARANALAMAQAYDESEAVTSFVERMIASVDPYKQGRGDVPMRDVLGRMSDAVDEEFADRPLLRARLHHFVGQTMRGLSLVKESEPHLRQAVEIRRSMLDPDDPRTLDSAAVLGSVTRDLGNYEESLSLLTHVLGCRRRLLGADHAETLRTCRELALTCFVTARHDDALALLAPAWDRARSVLGDRHEITLDLAEGLMSVRAAKGEANRVAPFARDVYLARVEEQGETHPMSLLAAIRLTDVYLWEGRYEDARQLAARTFELSRARLGEGHLQTYSSAFALGRAEMELARFEEANRLFGAVADAWGREFGTDNRTTLLVRLSLAESCRALGRLEQAKALSEEALQAAERVLGGDHDTTLAVMSVLATTCRDLGQDERARSLYHELLGRQRRVHGASHPRTLTTLHNLAASLSVDEARLDEAASRFEEVLEVRRRDLGPDHPNSLKTASWLGNVYYLQDRFSEALAVLSETVEAGRRSLPEDHWELGVSLRRMGACLRAMQRFPEAEAALLEARRILDLRLGPDHAETVQARADLDALVAVRGPRVGPYNGR